METIRKHPTATFLALAFVLGWWPWWTGVAPEASPFIPSPLGLALAWVVAGRRGFVELLRAAIKWRAPSGVWAFALLGVPTLYLLALGIHVLFGGEAPPFTAFREELEIIPLFFLFMMMPITGQVGEELGWRGFAQPRLMRTYSAVKVGLIIGTVWGVWHLPDFFADEGALASLGLGFFVPFIIGTIANSVFMTYLWIRSMGSVLIAGFVWHFSTNFWSQLMLSDLSLKAVSEDGVLPTIDPTLYAITVGVLVAGAMGLIVATRGRLGLDDPDEIARRIDEITAECQPPVA